MGFEGKVRPDHAGRQNEGKLRTEAKARGHAAGCRKDDAEEGIMPQHADSVNRLNPLILIGNRFGKLDRDPREDLMGGNKKQGMING